MTVPYNGFLIGAAFRGAGVEAFTLHFSSGVEDQGPCPGKDIAVDSDTLAYSREPGKGIGPNQIVMMNQKVAAGEKIGYTPWVTGTAEANVYFVFSPSSVGPYTLNQANITLNWSTASLGDRILDCPTHMKRLQRVFHRGAGGENGSIKMGAGGQTIEIPARAIAIYTDAVPHGYHPIDIVVPDEILFEAMNGHTGISPFYAQFE